MASLIYGLCTVTALLCAVLLLRAYRKSGYRLLLWSGLCFIGLTFNNIFLVLDKLVFPEIDLAVPRTGIALAAMSLLLYALIWESE